MGFGDIGLGSVAGAPGVVAPPPACRIRGSAGLQVGGGSCLSAEDTSNDDPEASALNFIALCRRRVAVGWGYAAADAEKRLNWLRPHLARGGSTKPALQSLSRVGGWDSVQDRDLSNRRFCREIKRFRKGLQLRRIDLGLSRTAGEMGHSAACHQVGNACGRATASAHRIREHRFPNVAKSSWQRWRQVLRCAVDGVSGRTGTELSIGAGGPKATRRGPKWPRFRLP